MRKIAILVGAVALLTMLVAGVALAREFNCTTNPCQGTSTADIIYERAGNGVPDTINAARGADQVYATTFTNDVDVLRGQRGDDRLDARDGDGLDTLNGGSGFDRCFGDVNVGMPADSDVFVNCEVINGVVQ